MMFSGLILIIGIVTLIMGFIVKADTTFEDISYNSDPHGKVDEGFMLLTTIMCVPILGASISAFLAGYFKARICVTCFAILAAALMGFMFAVGAGFYALKIAGDDFCTIVNDPTK